MSLTHRGHFDTWTTIQKDRQQSILNDVSTPVRSQSLTVHPDHGQLYRQIHSNSIYMFAFDSIVVG